MTKFLVAIITLLVFLNIYLFYYNNSLIKEKDQIILNLTHENKLLENEIVDLKNKLSNLTKEVEILKENLQIYEFYSNYYQKRKSWIKKNVNYNFNKSEFTREVIKKCIDQKINLPCILGILREKYKFEYKNESKDMIKSVEEFIKDRGGDCEDWSLFLLSFLKYLRENLNKTILLTCYKSGGEKFKLYEDENVIYYIPHCKALEIDLRKFKNLNIICYEENESLGHCVLALSKNILTPENLNSEVYLIESQNGLYLGILKDLGKEVYIILNEEDFYFRKWGWWK